MIWESNKLLTMINKSKWNKLNIMQRKVLIAQLQIWLAIHYLIKLNLSGYSIEHQYKLLINYYNNHPQIFQPLSLSDLIQLYARIRPLIPYFLYLNYITAEHVEIKSNGKTKNRTSKTKNRTSKTKNRTSKTKNRTSKTNNKLMKGGYLFMLTSRGEKPIRGVDMEKFLSKMDSSIKDISYLPGAGPNTEDNPGQPFKGFAFLYFMARDKLSDAAFYGMPYMADYMNLKSDGYKFGNTINLWSEYQKTKQQIEKKQSMEEEYMSDYEKYVKKYIGRKEYRTKKDEYKEYLNNIEKHKNKHEMEDKLYEHYTKQHPIETNKKLEQYQKYAGILDTIGMVSGMLPS
jgi:hypothetical protein